MKRRDLESMDSITPPDILSALEGGGLPPTDDDGETQAPRPGGGGGGGGDDGGFRGRRVTTCSF